MESGVTLADLRKEENLETNCNKLGIEYITPEPNETKNERDARHQQLQLSINNKRRCQNNAESPDKRRRVRDSNTAAQRHRRANLSPEQQESERRNITAFRQRQRANLSPEQQENARRINTGSRQQQRANRTSEQQENERRINTASRQQQRANRSSEQQENERRDNTASRQQSNENDGVDTGDKDDVIEGYVIEKANAACVDFAKNYEKKAKKWNDSMNKASVGIIRNTEYKKLVDVIGYHSTLDAVAKIYGGYFEDGSFKDIAADVIAMHFRSDVDMATTIKELEFRHRNE